MAIVSRAGISQTLTLAQTTYRGSAMIGGQGMSVPFVPWNWERWPGKSIYVSNGLQPIQKWNGTQDAFVPVGLPTPSGTPALADSGSGTITGTYRIYVRFIDEDGNTGPLSTVSADATVSAILTWTFSSISVPSDSRVVKRQILRNTDGQAQIYYVDVETSDLISTSFTSTKTDTQLAAQTAVELFDENGDPLASAWSAPRDDKPIIVYSGQRLFALGETEYSQGMAQVTFGSTTVTGIGTWWTSQLANREFAVQGHPKRYTISSVSETAQTLTLSEIYIGPTDLFGVYSIRPPIAQRNTIYYCQPGEPDQWHPQHGITIEDAGGALVAGFRGQSYVFLATTSMLHQLSFDSDPAEDGSATLFAQRGCINQRTWCRANELIFVMDRRGIYAISEQRQIQEVDRQIRNLFSQESVSEYHIDWTASHYFSACADPEDNTVRFYVSLSGPSLPMHAICYDYVLQYWWLEEYPFPVSASTLYFKPGDRPRPLVCSQGLRLLEQGVGATDGLNPLGYTTRMAVVSATATSVTVANLGLPASGVAFTPVAVVKGKGKGQLRLIDSTTGNTIRLTQPWTDQPDSTSTIQIGALSWRLKTGWMRRAPGNTVTPFEVVFEPRPTQTTMDLRVYHDHSTTPEIRRQDKPLASADSDGIGITNGSPDLEIDLRRSVGFVKTELSEPTGPRMKRGDYLAFELRGLTNPDGIIVYSLGIGPE